MKKLALLLTLVALMSGFSALTSLATTPSQCGDTVVNTSYSIPVGTGSLTFPAFLHPGDTVTVSVSTGVTDLFFRIKSPLGTVGYTIVDDSTPRQVTMLVMNEYKFNFDEQSFAYTVTLSCAPAPIDADNDGVDDGIDLCLGTPFGDTVDSTGCTVVVVPPVIDTVTPTITFSAPEISDGRENPKNGDSNLVLYSTTLDGSPALVAYEVEGSKGVFACFITEADFAGDAPAENTLIRACGQNTRLYRLTDGQLQANTLINGKETAIIFNALPPTRVRSYIVGEGS